jgi:hypothetical protein
MPLTPKQGMIQEKKLEGQGEEPMVVKDLLQSLHEIHEQLCHECIN